MGKYISYKYGVLITVFFILLAVSLLLSIGIKDNLFLALATVNCVISVIAVFSDSERPYSINKLVNLFILLFFVYANSIQFAHGSIVTSVWVSYSIMDYRLFQLIVLFILILYNTAYLYTVTRVETRAHKMQYFNVETNNSLLIIIAILAFIVILMHFRSDYAKLFFRGIEGDLIEAQTGGQSISLIFNKFLRVLPWSCFMIASLSKTKTFTRLVLFVICLVSLFPTSLSRNAIALYWLPIALIYFHPLGKRNVFVIIMLLGMLIIFPLLGSFRFYSGTINYSAISLDYLDTMNYDASQEFMAVIKMRIITYGKQLLGVLLFFIPRRFWPDKPIGSGAFVAQSQFEFSNVSMPFWGEGYINYGWLGVIVFSLLLSFISASLDKSYWSHKSSNTITVRDGYYLIVLSSIFFLLRGDLMSSFAYLVGALVSYMFVFKLTIRYV